MDLNALWIDLEARLPLGSPGRMQQRILPDGHADLFAAVASPGPRRSVMLQVDSSAVRDLDDLPSARGVSVELTEGGGHATIELQLTDSAASDVFTGLAIDVARAAASAQDDEGATLAFVGRLSRWMRLLRQAPRGLSAERQRGLYAELWFLRDPLARRLGAEVATGAWQAPSRAPHDFQAAGGAVEVKSSAANQPQVVRVNGERQLDETGTASLHLVHLSLDVHRDSGETLPQVVQTIRALVADTPAQPTFEDRLLDSGYADVHEPIYGHTGYTIRELSTFAVTDGFPRIVEADLPDGVGGVSYKLAIAACMPFKVPDEQAVKGLGGVQDAG
jgi:Putative  PD-(D/E)XK family member, (DUF4420)